MKRRNFLGLSLFTLILAPLHALAAVWNKAAFQADNLTDAEKGLSINQEIPSEEIEVVAPSHAENGAIVQIAVHSRIPNTEAIAILVEKNPTALIGNYLFYQHALPRMVTRIKMAETSAIKVIVKSGNQYFTTSKKVEVLENGCGGSSSKNEKFISSMKLRAKLLADAQVVEMKAIITHPMHTGLGKDDVGQLIPAHFIQLITIKHNENPIIEMQLGTGISKNPYFTFYLKSLNIGDQLVLAWQDNQGLTGQGVVAVTQGDIK
jgi:thiosulfate oxidation carrier complex protein SoxZ